MNATLKPNISQEATSRAKEDTMLSPRFYKTDFAAMDRIDVSPIRRQWDELIAEFQRDPNAGHFDRDPDFTTEAHALPDALHQEFMDFLISSITSEFSGCILYAEIKKRCSNTDMRELFGFMARDESRHAGFINKSLKHFGVGIDLGFLTKTKKYT